jgi:hypothetical protein
MPTVEERLITLERQIKIVLATTSALQGQPADATLSIPHNDSWIFEDNVDATHAANLRYIISKNVTRVVSARLSIFMAAYRTYNNFSATTTGGESATHNHTSNTTTHNHTTPVTNNNYTNFVKIAGNAFGNDGGLTSAIPTNQSSSGATDQNTADHTHLISVTSTLGVTEGATATGVTLSFDGVDATAALGGPFNADVIELDVRHFIQVAQGVKHTVAMTPSGLGRIEAHLRLGVYVSAGQAG